MLYRRERQSAALLSALMSQTKDTMVCFTFRRPVDRSEPQDVIDAKLRDAIVVDASRSFARYFGFENREDIIGKHLLKLFGGEIPSWFVDYGQEVEDRAFENIERIVEIPLGEKRYPMRVHMQNIFDGDLLVSQWLTIRDVSKEQEQARVIEENERLKLLALEAIGLRTYSLDFDLKGDPHSHGLMTLDSTEPYPEWWANVHPDDQPVLEQGFAAFVTGQTDLLHSVFRTQVDGEEKWMESWGVARRRNERGEPEGVVGVVMDRTQSKALEARMMASQRLESLGVMAGGIAHDFNNLLVSIIGSLDIAAARHPEIKSELGVIDEAAQQAAQLCDQLLTYAGRGTSAFDQVNLNEVVMKMQDLLAVSTHASCGIVYKMQEECWISGDGGQLSQVVMNLAKNASDALEGRPGTIEIETGTGRLTATAPGQHQIGESRTEQRYSFLKVKDDGRGIPASEMERLFDPFYTTKFTGRGLGLAVVMGVVRGHDGIIRVESEPGSGTTIEVWIPLTTPQTARLAETEDVATLDLAGCVLVVDDEHSVRRVAERLLATIGVEAVLADSGEHAISLVDDDPRKFDAVLMDVSMPGLDGVETASRILAAHPNTHIVMCSGYSNVAVSDQLANQVQFLQKPFRIQQLRDTLAPFLGT